MSMTYASLVEEVMEYLNRVDAATRNRIPNFINQAQQQICRLAPNIGFQQYITGDFTPQLGVYPHPARWRRSIALNVGSLDYPNNPNVKPIPGNYHNPVEIRDYDYLRMAYPDQTQTDLPKIYAEYGFYNFIVAPTPDKAYPFEYTYLEIPVTLSTTQQTNWLTSFAPDVLLNATLLQAIPFLKNDERIPVWQDAYKVGMASLISENKERYTDRQTNRGSD